MPRGGFRVGSGRKPWKNVHRLVKQPEAAAAPAQKADPPVEASTGLPADVQAVWDALAPRATAEGTLVPSTEAAFRLMCELAAHQAKAQMELAVLGFTPDGLKVQKVYAALTRLVVEQMRAFRVAPIGKSIAPVANEKPMSPLERMKAKRQGLRAVK
jgi:hypothetical protein